MLLGMLIDWSIKRWFSDVGAEFYNFLITMTPTHWMIISACGVAFGFLCLKGTGIK